MNESLFKNVHKLVSSCQKSSFSSQKVLSQKNCSYCTSGTDLKMTSKPPLHTVASVFLTGSPDPPFTSLNKHVNLPDFYEGNMNSLHIQSQWSDIIVGSKTAIEVVSDSINQRNFPLLCSLLTSNCQSEERNHKNLWDLTLSMCVLLATFFEKILWYLQLRQFDGNVTPVQREDIFYQFISDYKISENKVQVDLGHISNQLMGKIAFGI